ncbi:hypothetical protein EO238_31100, partial [Citrobacter sp. AAK_AS5]
DYVNLHGTATPLNDPMDSRAVAAVFGEVTAVSSSKGMSGHTLGAAAALASLELLTKPAAAKARQRLEQIMRHALATLWILPQ